MGKWVPAAIYLDEKQKDGSICIFLLHFLIEFKILQQSGRTRERADVLLNKSQVHKVFPQHFSPGEATGG